MSRPRQPSPPQPPQLPESISRIWPGPKRKGQPVPVAVLQAKYKQGLALHGRGDLDGAEALYREILTEMPESFHALHMLGVLAGQRRAWEQSEHLIAWAIRIDPEVAAAHTNLGNTLRVLNRRDEALASYERALLLQPDNARALKGRGLILWEMDEREQALKCYERLLEIEPDYVDGWIMKGAALNHMGRNGEAVAAYRKALEFDDVGHPDKIRYVLASLGSEAVPAASPVDYVRDLFDKYARGFDDHLVKLLHYRTPELLVGRIQALLPPRGSTTGRSRVDPSPSGGPARSDGFGGSILMDVLDLGCGTGLCGPLLKPWARTLVGIDLSEKMLEEARLKQVYDTLAAAEIGVYLADQHASFDLIVAADVFVYIGDLSAVFRSAHAALRPDGLFAFSTEVSETGEVVLSESLRYSHSEAYLRRLAAETGWRVDSLTRDVLREENQQGVHGLLAVLRRA